MINKVIEAFNIIKKEISFVKKTKYDELLDDLKFQQEECNRKNDRERKLKKEVKELEIQIEFLKKKGLKVTKNRKTNN